MLDIKELQNILNTCPIGYYLKYNIPVKIDENAPTSFIDFDNKQITISLNNFITNYQGTTLSNVVRVRSVLYHELSHALLTPEKLLREGEDVNFFNSYYFNNPADIVNVFEDERIETLLKCYYLEVNFKENIKAICNYQPNIKPKNAFDMFYKIVRFEEGPADLIKLKNEIIKKHNKINFNTTKLEKYLVSIFELYAKCEAVFGNKNNQQQPQNSNNESNETATAEADEENNATAKQGQATEEEATEEASFGGINSASKKALEEIQKEFHSVIKNYDTQYIKNALKRVLDIKTKKSFDNGAGYSYSGKINPKKYVDKTPKNDYRVFKRNNDGAETGAAKIKFNLFLDTSGSFHRNSKMMDRILKALYSIENQNLIFETAVFGSYTRKLSRDVDFNACDGGTYLDENFEKLFHEMNRNRCKNYNIFLCDGSVGRLDRIALLNNINSIIIYESSNAWGIEAYAPKARKHKENKNYCDTLLNNLINLLNEVIR